MTTVRTPRDVTSDGPPFRIDADGQWWHGEVRIARIELVKLFASILVREPDGSYWMVNPAERCHVNAEDVPYVVATCTARDGAIDCVTTLDETVTISADHPLTMRGGKPYVMVRAGCEGRLNTQAYYQIVAMAVQRNGQLYISSNGAEFHLGAAT
jgi:hypothetical protein